LLKPLLRVQSLAVLSYALLLQLDKLLLLLL
jgi:hypothetical protein